MNRRAHRLPWPLRSSVRVFTVSARMLGAVGRLRRALQPLADVLVTVAVYLRLVRLDDEPRGRREHRA